MTVDLFEKECETTLVEQNRLSRDLLLTKPGVFVFLNLATWRGDLSYWDRIHLLFEWMLPGAGAAWLVAKLRIRFGATAPAYVRYLCLVMALAGVTIGHLAYSDWMSKPNTQ